MTNKGADIKHSFRLSQNKIQKVPGYTTDILIKQNIICYSLNGKEVNTMKSGNMNFNVKSYLKHEQLPIIEVDDYRLFDMLSASECFRFPV